MDPSRDRGDEAVNWVTAWQVTARSCMSVQVAKALGVSHQAIHGMLRTALNWVAALQATAKSCMPVQVAKVLGVSHQAIHGMLRTALKQLHGQHKPALQALLATMT